MTFKKLMLTSTATLALLAGPAFAYDAEGGIEAGISVKEDAAGVTMATSTESTDPDANMSYEADEVADTEIDEDAAASQTADAMTPDVQDETVRERVGLDDADTTLQTDMRVADSEAPSVEDLEDITTTATAALSGTDAFNGMTVGDIVGMNVRGSDNEIVGEIDYVIDANGGKEAVIGIDGILGLGEYTVALPLDRFKLDAEDEVLVLSQFTEEELEAMPEIDESELVALDDDIIIN